MTRKILATLLLCLATFPLPTVGATDLPQYVRAGLFYDDSQLVSANLENLDNFGAGYQFGYFDQKTNFVYLGETTHTQITMVRGGTVYRTGKDFSTSSGDQAMGGYHVIHSSPYNSYQEALTVAETLSGGFVAWINGEFQVRMGTFTSEANAKAVGSNVAQASATLINMVKSGTTELIFQFDGGSSYPFGVSPDVTGHSDPITWFKNIKYRGAFQYQRVSGGSLTVSNVVALDSYLKGVVPFEMSPSWPIEALKTQAVSARTYVTKQILSSTHGSSNFDVCNTAHCQVYYGTGGPSTSSPSVNSDSAVDQTSGMYLWYQDTLAGTYYSSSFGGGSESVYNVWRSSSVDAYPYLCGVVDPYEQLANSINYYSSWNLTFTTSELTTLLNGKGLGVGSSVSSLEAVYSDTGNVIELIIHWSSGRTNTLYPTEMRYSSWLALPSIHFTINQDLPSVSTPETSTGDGYMVNGTTPLDSLAGAYVITGNGTTSPIDGNPYVITGNGTISQANTSEGTTSSGTSNMPTGSQVAKGSVYSFNGSGWGHNVGMSQFGAYAMAYYKNFTYTDILEFYYPGTHVGTT